MLYRILRLLTGLAVLPFSRSLSPGWRMTSFSALSAGRHSEAPDYDALPAVPIEAPPLLDIFAFPRGAQPGTCLHAIFEEWEFNTISDVKLGEPIVELFKKPSTVVVERINLM